MRHLRARLLVTLLSAACGLSACGGNHGSPAACGGSDATPVVRIAHWSPIGHHMERHPVISPMMLTDAALATLDAAGHPRPALAREWQTSDKRTWTVILRDHLQAHDGTPITADHVRESVLAQAKGYDPVWHDVQRIDAPTPTTLVFHLARPSALFLEALASFGIQHHGKLSAGPFRITRELDDQIDYEAFPGFWNRQPGPMGVRVKFYPDPRASWAAFLRNEADFLYEVPTTAVGLLARNPNIRLYANNPGAVMAMGFQLRSPLLRDVRVRQAINLAIDRNELVQRVFGGYPPQIKSQIRPVIGPFAPSYWALENIGSSTWRYDPVNARALLQAALPGRKDPIELRCLTTNQFPLPADITALLEAQLARVHIRLRLEALAVEPLERRFAAGDYDVFVSPMNAGRGGLWPYTFWHGGAENTLNRSGYTGADAQLDALYTAATPEAERAAVHDVLDAMYRDPPAAFLLPIPTIRAVRTRWHVPEDQLDIRASLSRWTIDPTAPCGAS
jgi:ABC-type transport system substrate-binding protein